MFCLRIYTAPKAESDLEKPHAEKELFPMEMVSSVPISQEAMKSSICRRKAKTSKSLRNSSARGAESASEVSTEKLPEFIENDLSTGSPYGNAVAGEQPDRGALQRVFRVYKNLSRYSRRYGGRITHNNKFY